MHRMLKAEDQVRLVEVFEFFLHGKSGQYLYHLKKEDFNEHIQKIGEVMHFLLAQLSSGYAAEKAYQVLERVCKKRWMANTLKGASRTLTP
jgi:hypothetical protein